MLTIQSSDVIHSWWIPSLGGKVDAVPGYTTYTWFKASHTGVFRGQCAQLCGTNHAAMVAYVRAVVAAAVRDVAGPPGGADHRPEQPGRPAAPDPHFREPARQLGAARWQRSPPIRVVRPVPQVLAHEVIAPRKTKKWVDWVLTTDHKKIGIMYLVLTFVFFCMGGVEALMMRTQLSVPNNTLLTSEHYNQLLTLHGTTMIFLFVVPVWAGLRQLLPAADDRRPRHGVPAPERAVVLAAGVRRHRVLRHALLPPAGRRLVELSAALGDRCTRRRAARTRGSS